MLDPPTYPVIEKTSCSPRDVASIGPSPRRLFPFSPPLPLRAEGPSHPEIFREMYHHLKIICNFRVLEIWKAINLECQGGDTFSVDAGLGSWNICILYLTRKLRSFYILNKFLQSVLRTLAFSNANRFGLGCKATKDTQNLEPLEDIIGSES